MAIEHKCKITVLECKCFNDYQEKYLADPKSGPCPCFKPGDTAPACRLWRQHRGMVRHEGVASQDNAQEVQVWCAGDIYHVSSSCSMDNQ